MNELLKNLIASGAALDTNELGFPATLLADAVFLDDRHLWFCGVWPENDFAQHWIEFEEAKEQDGLIILKNGERLYSIAPMELGQRELARWDKWIGDDGRDLRQFVAGLKENALAEAKKEKV